VRWYRQQRTGPHEDASEGKATMVAVAHPRASQRSSQLKERQGEKLALPEPDRADGSAREHRQSRIEKQIKRVAVPRPQANTQIFGAVDQTGTF